jgi:hypothetical protein
MTPNGTLTTLYSFTGGADGGSASEPFDRGPRWESIWSRRFPGFYAPSMFKITTSGVFTTLYNSANRV